MNALLISTDLMALSAAEGAARSAGVKLHSVGPKGAVSAALEMMPALIAIDLSGPIDDVRALVDDLCCASPGVRFIAYAPHVHEARLQAARDAGCDHVISRGQFHKGFGELLANYAASAD